jgi:hypothetical protein
MNIDGEWVLILEGGIVGTFASENTAQITKRLWNEKI